MKDRIEGGDRSEVMKHVARGRQIGRYGAAPKLAKSDSHWQCLAKKGPDRQTEHLTDPIRTFLTNFSEDEASNVKYRDALSIDQSNVNGISLSC